jgi:hypothetical protein
VATDGSYEVQVVIKIKATGTDHDALTLMGNIRRFMKLDILQNAEIVNAWIVRDDILSRVPVSTIPVIKN